MTQMKNKQKTQKLPKTLHGFGFFFTKSHKNENGNICVLGYNFWANYNLDLFIIFKWPSDTQFCERYNVDGQKMARNGCKTAICQSTFLGHPL